MAWHVRKELQYYLYESGTDTDLHFHFRFYFQFLSRFLIWVKFDEHLYFFPEPRQIVFFSGYQHEIRALSEKWNKIFMFTCR